MIEFSRKQVLQQASVKFGGRKSRAFRYGRFSLILVYLKRHIGKKNPNFVFKIALDILAPRFDLRTKKVAAQKLKIPHMLSEGRRFFYALNWLFDAAKARPGDESFEQKVALEIFQVYKLRGVAYQKKKDLYKEVEANRMYLRFLK